MTNTTNKKDWKYQPGEYVKFTTEHGTDLVVRILVSEPDDPELPFPSRFGNYYAANKYGVRVLVGPEWVSKFSTLFVSKESLEAGKSLGFHLATVKLLYT